MPGQLVQCAGQRAGGDVPVTLLVLTDGGGLDQHWQSGGAQAEAEQGGLDGMPQAIGAVGTAVNHAALLKMIKSTFRALFLQAERE